MFKFELGQAVDVAPYKDDPGGRGNVNARKVHEEAGKPTKRSYRVLIVGNAKQSQSALKADAAGERVFQGFWYDERFLSELE